MPSASARRSFRVTHRRSGVAPFDTLDLPGALRGDGSCCPDGAQTVAAMPSCCRRGITRRDKQGCGDRSSRKNGSEGGQRQDGPFTGQHVRGIDLERTGKKKKGKEAVEQSCREIDVADDTANCQLEAESTVSPISGQVAGLLDRVKFAVLQILVSAIRALEGRLGARTPREWQQSTDTVVNDLGYTSAGSTSLRR
jgi:hypothetical protein